MIVAAKPERRRRMIQDHGLRSGQGARRRHRGDGNDHGGRRDDGTLGYMAPEMLTGGAVDERADLFAIGVMLVEA